MRNDIRMDIAAYVFLILGAIALAFAGFHGFPNRFVTVVSCGLGSILMIVGGCCYWLGAILKEDAIVKNPVDDQRAWLTVVGANVVKPPVLGEKIQVRIKFRNQGKTPAFDVCGWGYVFSRFRDYELLPSDLVDRTPQQKIVSRAVIGADTPYYAILDTGDVLTDQRQIDNIASGENRLFAMGHTHYRDSLNNPHVTAYCFVLVGATWTEDMSAYAIGNTAD